MSSTNSKAVFLDVDSSIVEKNLRFTSTEDDELNKFFGAPGQSHPSKLVQPTPGFCIKTREIGNDTKVFINICQTDEIPAPKNITEAELLEIAESDAITDFRIPMSIGEMRPENDKKGEASKACDVAIHPNFFTKIQQIQTFKNFFMAVLFQGLENKYGLVCVDEKIILKNRKAYGKLQMHRIQQREVDEKMGKITAENKSIIEEIAGEKQKPKSVVIETLSSLENVAKEPEYRLYKKKGGHHCLIGEFKLPDVISAKDLTLDVGEDRILLESKCKGYLLDIFVPYIVRQETCSSSFDKTSKILTVKMPLVGG